MTPALSILCAVLVAVIFAQMLHYGKALRNAVDAMESAANAIAKQRQQSEADAALLAEAHALLHDTAARGKDGRWLPWSERRATWVEKCKARG